MPFNGSGTFNLYTPGNPVVDGTDITVTWANFTFSDLATGLSTALTKDGQTTPTANIPMGGYKLTNIGAANSNGDAVRWQQSAAGVMTTLGDTLYASAANTPARLAAKADVAAHATTSNLWVAKEVVLTGTAVTFTDIADAPFVGATVWVYQNAAHTWTNGATFAIQGGANYTAAAGDWIRIYATTVSTFQITVFPVAPAATQSEQETATNSAKFVTPATQQYHPSALKGWVMADTAGSAAASYNVTSLTDNGAGDVTVNWNIDFSGAAYFAVASPRNTPGGTAASTLITNVADLSFTAGTTRAVTVRASDWAGTDPNYTFVAVAGDQ